jgi:hypothetical protein
MSVHLNGDDVLKNCKCCNDEIGAPIRPAQKKPVNFFNAREKFTTPTTQLTHLFPNLTRTRLRRHWKWLLQWMKMTSVHKGLVSNYISSFKPGGCKCDLLNYGARLK